MAPGQGSPLVFSHTFWSLPSDKKAPRDPNTRFKDIPAGFYAGHVNNWSSHLFDCLAAEELWFFAHVLCVYALEMVKQCSKYP